MNHPRYKKLFFPFLTLIHLLLNPPLISDEETFEEIEFNDGADIHVPSVSYTDDSPLIETTSQKSALDSMRIDLREPTFKDGVLYTTSGGVIEGKNIRIQAEKINYTRKTVEGVPICTIFAEGNLILDFGDTYFVAESLEFDFIKQEGVLYKARTALSPWFFGGEKIVLFPDGSFMVYDAYITTSESEDLDWEINAEEAYLTEKRYLRARNVQFRAYRLPLLWLPAFRTDLDAIFDAPVRYDFKWGGHQGVRGTMIYQLFNWNRFKTYARLDYRIKRGFGGGIETYYKSEDQKEYLNTINYFANDNSLSNLSEHYRYRFQGIYHNLFLDDKVSLDLTWDKLSDQDMATDYDDRGLELDTAGRTQLLIRKQEENRIERLITNVKVNSFESIKQELPTLELTWKPKTLGETGIILSSLAKASYLDFSYSNDVARAHNFNSTRVEVKQTLFRPFYYNGFIATPKAEVIGIYYGNTPHGNDKGLIIGYGALDLRTRYFKNYNCFKHLIEPYAKFEYYTIPTATPHEHYIFDIDDGWYRANWVRLGTINQWTFFSKESCLTRPLYLDIYTYGFFDTKTIGEVFPKGYLSLTTLSLPTLRHTFEACYDFQHGELGEFNFRSDWTASNTLAIRGEYRHRNPYIWRKADTLNFILDSYRSEKELLHSQLSDRRDTLLAAMFYQFDINWALKLELRHGWNRKYEPSYTEYEVDFIGHLPSAWNVKLSYQHREDNDRVALYFSIGIKKPNQKRCEGLLPCLEL